MESFIYLLITIVILVLSMRKRKPARPVSEGDENLPGDPFTDLFKDENDEDYEHETQPSTVPGQQTYEAGRSNPWMTETEAQDRLMNADTVMKEAAENNPIADLEGKVEDDAYSIDIDENKGIPFDLRKAVIYSEILGRKTF